MTGKEAMKYAMNERRMTQDEVALKAGYKGRTNVSEVLRVKNARVDSLVRILNACGYDLIMVDRYDKEKRYAITNEDGENGGVETASDGFDTVQPEKVKNGGSDMNEMFEAFQRWYRENNGGK